ncbi:hypothetical protein CC78DRAFT_589512 [Lojkania enalia]|uniref:F-box domain-containing protein n=1 Tax=Lojkania enalia TaxID=147567 RepID=A0A9P4K1V0_9PLEO|nr:hypothetical protein CC78DRAFT_589512 [Didymosphaeria enalia]
MNSLPIDVLYQIPPHLGNQDITSFRLVSKVFSDAGATELFRVIKFHISASSIYRLISLACKKHLSIKVHHLVWDAKLWDLGVHNQQEFNEVVHRHAGPQFSASIIMMRKYYETYMRLRREESWLLGDILGQGGFDAILNRFQSLKCVSVLHGRVPVVDRVIQLEWFVGTNAEDEVLPIPKGSGAGMKDLENGVSGAFALKSTVIGLHAASESKPWKLYFSQVDFRFFDTANYPQNLGQCGEWLTSLTLTVCALTQYSLDDIDADEIDHNNMPACINVLRQGNLKLFLRGLRRLRHLNLRVGLWARFQLPEEYPSIEDALPLDTPWPYLESITLESLSATPESFSTLLLNHSGTLRRLEISYTGLFEPLEEWIPAFERIQPQLRLDFARFRFCFHDIQRPVDYERAFEDAHEDSVVFGKWFVHGGEYPRASMSDARYKKSLPGPSPQK